MSIFNELIHFKGYPKSRAPSKTGNFPHSLWLLKEICFSGNSPQPWRCSGNSNQKGEVSGARSLRLFLGLRRKSYLLHSLLSCCSMSSLFCPLEGKSGSSEERACRIVSSGACPPVLPQGKQFGAPRSVQHCAYC